MHEILGVVTVSRQIDKKLEHILVVLFIKPVENGVVHEIPPFYQLVVYSSYKVTSFLMEYDN